ncbi:MAG TPA: glycine cleavage system protein H [Anaeromyxobacter sp.]|nr:glycine cleavage system protein H [Anaeromyxobacter sp.]
MAHDFLSIYPAKLQEYCLAVAYLLMFIPFWRYVQGGARPAARAEVVAAPEPRVAAAIGAVLEAARPAGATALRPATAGWFHVPPGVHLHPGHTWARLEPDGLVTVGIDDFAHKLVGPAEVELPTPGTKVAQGEPAMALCDEGCSVPMLSPVDGTVVAVNPAVKRDAAALDDPYGAGWLFKVKAPRLAANLRQLHGHAPATRMLEDASEALARRMDPELGRLLQDGGTPVHGIARALAGDAWEALAREFFLA